MILLGTTWEWLLCSPLGPLFFHFLKTGLHFPFSSHSELHWTVTTSQVWWVVAQKLHVAVQHSYLLKAGTSRANPLSHSPLAISCGSAGKLGKQVSNAAPPLLEAAVKGTGTKALPFYVCTQKRDIQLSLHKFSSTVGRGHFSLPPKQRWSSPQSLITSLGLR